MHSCAGRANDGPIVYNGSKSGPSMLYRYWILSILTGVVVALALTELWLKEDDISTTHSDSGAYLVAQDKLGDIPERYLRNIPYEPCLPAVAEAERLVRSGR